MKKPSWRLLSLLALVGVLLASCGGKTNTDAGTGSGSGGTGTTGGQVIKLGGYIDLTGATANVGEPYAAGLRDRFTVANKEGGVKGNTFELTLEDYGYTLPRAETAFTKFVTSEKMPLTFTWGTADVLAQIPKYAAAKVPTVSGALAENMAKASDAPYTFALGPTYAQQFRLALDFAKKNGAKKVGTVAMDTGSGREPLPFAEAYAKEIGVEWLGAEIVGAKSTDNSVQIRNIADKGADFIIVHQQDASATAQTVIDAARIGLKAKMIMTIWSADPVVAELSKDAVNGTYAIRPFASYGDKGAGIEKITKFLQDDKRDPAKVLNSAYVQGWLAGEVVLAAIKTVDGPLTGEKLKTALEGLKNLDTGGLSQPLTYSDTTHVGVNKSTVYQYKNGKQEPVS